MIGRKRCRAVLDYEVEVRPISRRAAREARRRRQEAHRLLTTPPDDPAGRYLFRLMNEALGPPTPVGLGPMPSAELIAAERDLQAALMADRGARDRWVVGRILGWLHMGGEENGTSWTPELDERILRPVLSRLSPSAREVLGVRDADELPRLPEFEASFRPLILDVRAGPVDGGDLYRAVVDWEVEIHELTERTVRRRLERQAVLARGLVGMSLSEREISAKVGKDMPSLQALETQRSLLDEVLADGEVLSQWIARVVVIDLRDGPMHSLWEYDESVDEVAVLTSLLETLPSRSRSVLEDFVGADNRRDRLVDFHESIVTHLAEVRVG